MPNEKLPFHERYDAERSDCSILVGPDGEEYWLTDHEDRSWGRDGREVVALLNKQHARVADLEREVETLKRLTREDKEARLKAIGEPI